MSSSNLSMTAAVDQVKRNTNTLVECSSTILIILGIVGHTLSIYVFTRRKLRSNPCARYFLASTIAGCFIVYVTLPLRLLQLLGSVDVFVYSVQLCKILSYILISVRVLPSWFIAMASVDRFLCSSSSDTIRAWSNIRVASRTIPIIIVLIYLIYIHIPICYIIQMPQKTCVAPPGIYQTFLSIWHLIIWSWVPNVCMLTFGFLTVRHVRQGRMRVTVSNTQNNSYQSRKRTDRQLIQMMLGQSFVLTSTTSGYSFYNLYVAISVNPNKNALEKAEDTFTASVFSYLALAGPCVSFYLFTLSSPLFRRELINLFHSRHQQTIETINNQTVKIPKTK